LNKKTSSNKKNNDKQIFEKTVDAFFANDLDRKKIEKYIFKLLNDMIELSCQKVIHRLDFHHRSETSFDVTR
jgi:hypothetical protein